MRTYFIIAALMGIFAFGSISLLAHAQEDASANRIAAPAAEQDAMTPPVSEEEAIATEEEPDPTAPDPQQAVHDKKACNKAAFGRKGGAGDKRTPEQRKLEFENCMSNLGYTMDEIEGSATP